MGARASFGEPTLLPSPGRMNMLSHRKADPGVKTEPGRRSEILAKSGAQTVTTTEHGVSHSLNAAGAGKLREHFVRTAFFLKSREKCGY